MREDERAWAVKELLFDYVKSPSLAHIRSPHALTKLAHDIVRAVDRRNSIWGKWDGQRELLLKSALPCWIPIEDLRDYLNKMPGPALTTSDVAQRFKALEAEEHYGQLAKDQLEAGCLALYEREKGEGTEMPAIIGVIRDHVESEEQRLLDEQQVRHARWREEDRIAREQRLLSGADCNWTQLKGALDWHCRKNGRTYRLAPTKDQMWALYRVTAVGDEKGPPLGRYQRRGDATKAVAAMAYQPEPRW